VDRLFLGCDSTETLVALYDNRWLYEGEGAGVHGDASSRFATSKTLADLLGIVNVVVVLRAYTGS
jgi:hypothetical protein